MNTEFYNELKANDAEERNINSLNKLGDILREKVNKVNIDEQISLLLTFYSYVSENYNKNIDTYKNNWQSSICAYYSLERIENNFSSIVSNKKYLRAILDLGDVTLLNNIMQVAYNKAKNGGLFDIDNYISLKKEVSDMDFDVSNFPDMEEERKKRYSSISSSPDNVLKKIDEFDKIVDAKPLETPVLDNSNINEYEKIANSAMDKINEIVNNRNVELPKEDKTEEKKEEPKENSNSYDFSKFDDNYSSIKSMNDNLDKKEQELIEKQKEIEMERKRVERLEQRRENEMVLNASDDLGVSKEKLDNIINKSNIDLKEVNKIVISKEMLDKAANGYVANLPKSKFNNFLENIIRSNKLRKADFAVENLDGVNILKINSNDAVSKIASCEQKLFNKISNAAQKKASLKNKIVSFANMKKEEIISRISEAKERVEDSVYETRKNISNKLYHMAGKMSPDDYLSYDTSDRPPIENLNNNFNSNHNDDDDEKTNREVEDMIKALDEKRNSPEEKEITSILDEVNERRDHSEPKKVDDRELNKILDDLKNNRTYANSGTYVGNTESKIEEEIHKSM